MIVIFSYQIEISPSFPLLALWVLLLLYSLFSTVSSFHTPVVVYLLAFQKRLQHFILLGHENHCLPPPPVPIVVPQGRLNEGCEGGFYKNLEALLEHCFKESLNIFRGWVWWGFPFLPHCTFTVLSQWLYRERKVHIPQPFRAMLQVTPSVYTEFILFIAVWWETCMEEESQHFH